MASRHGASTKYRDSTSNIKVLLRQQTSMTLNERFRKIMKMQAPAPPQQVQQQRLRSPVPPPRDARLREELRAHQRKLESLERNTMQMMSRSLATLSNPVPVPSQPIYEPPRAKPSAKARLGGGPVRTGSAQSRIGAKRLSQKYSAMSRTTTTRGGGSFAGIARGGSSASSSSTRGTTRGRGGATRGTRGGSTRGAAKPAAAPAAKKPKLDKDELDSQLDKYMSKSKSYLDDQLDSYMAQKGDVKETTS